VNQENKALNIIEKLALNEEFISKLYKCYADKFLVLNEFWDSLATEELTHASWIRNLGLMTKNKVIIIDDLRFNKTAIQSYMNYIDREIVRINEQDIPLTEALSITFYIEDSLIESRFFEVFETDSVALKNTLAKLSEATKAHRKKAKQTLEKYKKKQ
jgi:hypothetical protein